MNVLVVGAGQLGSRHLQSLANVSEYFLNIDVVDPSIESLEVAKQRYESLGVKSHTVCYHKSIAETQVSSYQLAIVATNSNVRCAVVKDILKEKKLKYLILEKVLFQRTEEYYEIEQLLKQKNVSTWVNHPRRMFEFYRELKSHLSSSKNIHFSAIAGNWGLACNALHLLDLFSFLSNAEVETVDLSKLTPEILSAKREGFLEIDGQISGSLVGGHQYSISHYLDDRPLTITVSSDSFTMYIDEKFGLSIKYSSSENPVVNKGKIASFQSELTEKALGQLMQTGSCALPTYSEAMLLHLKFIEPLTTFINKQNNTNLSACPIT
jgi:hypothetical protein